MTHETRPARDLLSIPYMNIEVQDDHWVLDGAEYIEVPYTAWNDYVGGTVERSNHDAILDDFEDEVVSVSIDYGGSMLVIPAESEVSAALYDAIESLGCYPVYSEDHWFYLESDVEQEDWTLYGRDELREQAKRWAERNVEDDEQRDRFEEWLDDSDDALDSAYYDARSWGSVTWESESATGGYFQDLDALAERVAEDWLNDYDRIQRGMLPEWRCPGQITLDFAS